MKFIYKKKKFQGHDSERCINMILIHCRHALHRYATGRRHPNSRRPGCCRDPSAGPAVAELRPPRVQPEWGGQCLACAVSIHVFALLMLAMQITLLLYSSKHKYYFQSYISLPWICFSGYPAHLIHMPINVSSIVHHLADMHNKLHLHCAYIKHSFTIMYVQGSSVFITSWDVFVSIFTFNNDLWVTFPPCNASRNLGTLTFSWCFVNR